MANANIKEQIYSTEFYGHKLTELRLNNAIAQKQQLIVTTAHANLLLASNEITDYYCLRKASSTTIRKTTAGVNVCNGQEKKT